MNEFDSRMIFIGIVLVVTVLVWIVLDNKKSDGLAGTLDEKKKELAGIINDAEQMIEELNNFSEYIVNQMDLKNTVLADTLKKIDQKVEKLNGSILEKNNVLKNHRSTTGAIPEKIHTQADKLISPVPETVYSPTRNIKAVENLSPVMNQRARARDKVIPLNSRHKEILQLRDRGLDETEIARNLNVGKGEIQLILELNKKIM